MCLSCGVQEGCVPSPIGCVPKEQDMDLNIIIGLLLALTLFGWVVSRLTSKWLNMRERVRSLKLQLEKAEAEKEQSSKTLREMRERCRKDLLYVSPKLSWMLKVFQPDDQVNWNPLFPGLFLERIHALWFVHEGVSLLGRYEIRSASPIISWIDALHGSFLQAVDKKGVTSGHLATWRTEIAAAEVYLLQLDGRGRMGMGGGRRHFGDDELPKLVDLMGGMRWIIERTKTGNCPFPFGPYIERDLEALIARIETLESTA